ncbi:MAG: flavin reductase family protein [Nitrososphaerota archaeon]|jgi:flavin reductase (DIM6/NTAB) family NADH-FMN oxidoreductase RutF|nr:flavin reductase family protein [Nitrososphaerota archaeon]
MSVKLPVNFESAYRLLHPMHTVLVSCMGKAGKPNISTVAWTMPVSQKPPLIAISLAHERYSHSLIEESGEFIVNIPSIDMLQTVMACGTFSGRSFDKFKKANLTSVPGKRVSAPAILECLAHIECIVENKFQTGDHSIFVGKIVDAYADTAMFVDSYDIKKAHMVYHGGGNNFYTLDIKNYRP